jgi:hypothetical protein
MNINSKKLLNIALVALMIGLLALPGCGFAKEKAKEAAEPVADSENADSEPATTDANADNTDAEQTTDVAVDAEGASRRLTSVTISFEYERQSGHASNQLAVWIEDAHGGYVATLYATDFTASGGWARRPTSIPDWVYASGVSDGADFDAVSGATPSGGEQEYTWDMTDASGTSFTGDAFTVVCEGTLRWDNQIVYRCKVDRRTGEIVAENTEFLLRASDDGEKLAKDAPETSMLKNFKVTPHYGT